MPVPNRLQLPSPRRAMFASLLAMALAATLAHGQTLRIGLAVDPDVLDPTLARSFVGRVVCGGPRRFIPEALAPGNARANGARFVVAAVTVLAFLRSRDRARLWHARLLRARARITTQIWPPMHPR